MDTLGVELMDILVGELMGTLKVDILNVEPGGSLMVEPEDIPRETNLEVDRNQEGIGRVDLHMVAVKLVNSLEDILMVLNLVDIEEVDLILGDMQVVLSQVDMQVVDLDIVLSCLDIAPSLNNLI